MRTGHGFLALASLLIAPGALETSTAPPDWYEAHIVSMVADSGVWVADNSAYRSDQEPMDSYVIRWQRGIAPGTMRGDMYGISNGRRTRPFFEFRTYWHPGTRRVTVLQLGVAGQVAEGELTHRTDGKLVIEQTFTNPDGSTAKQRHVEELTGRQRIADSFVAEGATWTKGRTYLWVRQPAP